MMHDVALPGLPVELVQCPICEKLPEPDDIYPYSAPSRWKKLLESADNDAINDYLVRDRAFFEHDLVNGERCTVDILPGPALIGLTPEQAEAKADDLMRRLGLR